MEYNYNVDEKSRYNIFLSIADITTCSEKVLLKYVRTLSEPGKADMKVAKNLVNSIFLNPKKKTFVGIIHQRDMGCIDKLSNSSIQIHIELDPTYVQLSYDKPKYLKVSLSITDREKATDISLYQRIRSIANCTLIKAEVILSKMLLNPNEPHFICNVVDYPPAGEILDRYRWLQELDNSGMEVHVESVK